MRLLCSASFIGFLLTGCGAGVKPGTDGPSTDESDDTASDDGDDTGSVVAEVDTDEDGYTVENDCDDNDAAINPGAEEICDEVDNNCDGAIDEGLTTAYYPDADADGYGSDADVVEACDPVEGMTEVGGDCDDLNLDVNPLGIELCDGLDNNCDGETDGEDAADKSFWFLDADADGHGVTEGFVYTCDMPEGYADNDNDCDDADGAVFPDADEVCDGVDNNCDAAVDPPTALDAETWYRDADTDGYGNGAVSEVACDAASGFVADDTDCDDTDGLVHPDGIEVCDGVDQNCDGTIDEGFDSETYYHDYDGDGHGDPLDSVIHCVRPADYVTDSTDCDDDDYWRNPGLPELCDEKDNDCDEIVDEDLVDVDYYPDADADGYGFADGEVVTDCIPPDGYVVDATDCDDTLASVNPGEIESCNGVDDDCDDVIDEGLSMLTFYLDSDGDGYGLADETTEACDTPEGYADLDTDCDDELNSTHPDAYEFCDEVDNDCDGVVDDDCGTSIILGAYEAASCDDLDSDITEEGTYMRVSYNPDGTWMDYSGGGFEIGSGEAYYEACYPGSPWQATALEWSAGGSSYSYLGNRDSSSWDWETICAGSLGGDDMVAGVIHEWEMGDVLVTKTEIWETEGHVSRVWFDVENLGDDEITDFDLMMAVDPDQDMSITGGTTFATLNDVNDEGDIATSVGPTSGRALLFGICDTDAQVVGHTSPWSSDDDFVPSDFDGASGDYAVNWGHRDLTIASGDVASFGFLIAVGEDADEATEHFDEQVDILCTE